MKILTDEAVELLEKVKVPCSVEATVLEPEPSKWQRFLFRLLGYAVRLHVRTIDPDTTRTINEIGLWQCRPGDKVTIHGLYVGTEIVLPSGEKNEVIRQ